MSSIVGEAIFVLTRENDTISAPNASNRRKPQTERTKTMSNILRRIISPLTAAALALAPVSAGAETFRYAFQGDAQSLDPHSLNETFSLGFWGNIYEGLVRRGPDLKFEPALAVKWEALEPTRWRFHLRKGVKFHNGNAFTADDVVFSAQRVRAEGSDLQTRIAQDTQIVKVDDQGAGAGGGGDIEAQDLQAGDYNLRLQGSGDIEVN